MREGFWFPSICLGHAKSFYWGDLQPAAVIAWRRHADQTRRTDVSNDHQAHARASAIQAVLTNLAGFLGLLKATAEQLIDAQRLRAILTRAFAKFMPINADPLAQLAP